jgi:2'-hydroxyisoflavone reductase
MKILVLGGTIFLGRQFVEEALERGHEITIFNRGKSSPELFPQVEKLFGDRDGNLEALRGRRWDAALDTSGYLPRTVKESARLLSSSLDHYTFISSISVYDETFIGEIDEDSPVRKLSDETVEEITGETYGALKALCEVEVEKAMRGRVLHVRSGLIVGPGDPSDRFTYWPWRLAKGGEILTPGNISSFIQLVDVRDEAKWLVTAIEARLTGVFNVTGPSKSLTLRSVLESCQKAVGNLGQLTWVDEGFLLEEGVGEWVELPLWLAGEGSSRVMQVNVNKALESGLIFRPLEQSAIDTLSWAKSRPDTHQWRAGLTLERESQLLKKWHGRE